MDKQEFDKIFNLYLLCNKLKTTLRQGWLSWKYGGERTESIAEHIFGTCMLTVGIYSSRKMDIDIQKVITMLALHETEEILIGDITPFDFDKLITKEELGREAVLQVFKDFDNAGEFISLIDEFNENKTKEAQFANQCDKFEADLQAYLYQKDFQLDKVSQNIWEDKRIINLKNHGYNKICELFLQNDKIKFSGVILEMAENLEKMEKEDA